MLVTFPSCLVSKLEVGLRTCFLSGLGLEKLPQGSGRMLIFHCNIEVFDRIHSYGESLIFESLLAFPGGFWGSGGVKFSNDT